MKTEKRGGKRTVPKPPNPPKPQAKKTAPAKGVDVDRDLEELRVGIKKLVESGQEDRLEHTAAKLRREFENRLSEALADMRNEMDDVRKNTARYEISQFLADLKKVKDDVGGLRQEVAALKRSSNESMQESIGSFEERVAIEMERMEAKLKEHGEKANRPVLLNVPKPKEAAAGQRIQEQPDFQGLRRDIESLKMKINWLENQYENLDLGILKERIEELENELKTSTRVSHPIIIE
jgi:hypothetical protein